MDRTHDAAIAHDIRIVLVEPRHPGNVGAAARAMKTMGLEQLVLVRPAEHPSLEAEQRAVSAADVLAGARVVDRLDEAVADAHLVIATAGRDREPPLPVRSAREAAATAVREASHGASVAILFGSERDGLSNESLDACSFQLRIPTSDALTSLNLAAAVQLVCYEILLARTASEAALTSPRSAAPGGDDGSTHEAAPSRELEIFFDRLRATLDERAFFAAQNPEPTFRRIRRIIGRARPDPSELLLLHGLVKLMRPSRRAE